MTGAAPARRDVALETKAAALAVLAMPDGSFLVDSASRPGERHRVTFAGGESRCDCIGSSGALHLCAHRRAARRYLARHGRSLRSGAT